MTQVTYRGNKYSTKATAQPFPVRRDPKVLTYRGVPYVSK